MKSRSYTSRYCLCNKYSTRANWLTIIVCFICLATSAQILGQDDPEAAGELLCNIQQSNFYNFDEAILTTDFDRPHHLPIFIGIPPDQIQACGDALPNWPVVIAKFQDEELAVSPSERIDFRSCGGKMVTRTWTVSGPNGKESSRQQLITFSDMEPPLIIIASDTTVATELEVPQPYYEASDHGCSSFTVDITEEKVALNESESSIVRRYMITDGCGNTTSRSQQIHIGKTEVQQKQARQKSVSVLEFRNIDPKVLNKKPI